MTPNDTDPHLFARHLLNRDDVDAAGGRETPRERPSEANALAASLLENVSDSALPTEGVSQTDGHSAAAFASQGKRPPRAHESQHDEAAVVLNTTAPLVASDDSSAAAVAQARGNTTVRRSAMVEPSDTRSFRGRVLLGLAFLAVAVTALALAFTPKPQATGGSQPGGPVVLMNGGPHVGSTAQPAQPAQPEEVAAPASTYEPAESSATTTPTTPSVAHPAPRRALPRSTPPRRRSPRPTGTFDEPARSLD